MNKKILLSTILATTVIGGTSNAFAVISIRYMSGGGHTDVFTLDNHNPGAKEYSGKELANAITPRIRAGEPLNIDQASQQNIAENLMQARLDPNAQFMARDIVALAKILNQNLTEDEKTRISQGLGINVRKFTDKKHSPSQIQTHLNELSNLRETTRARYNAIDGNIASKDATIVALNEKIKALKAQKGNQAEIQAQITKLEKERKAKILSLPAYVAVRNSAQTQEELKQGLKAIEDLNNAAKSEDEKKFVAEQLGQIKEKLDLYLADESTTSHKTLSPVQKADTHTTNSIVNSSLTHNNVLTNRMSGFAGSGISAGDNAQTYGAWVKGNFGVGTQSAFKADPGYKYNQKGVTIGADTGDDEYVFGLALSHFRNDVTSKETSSTKDKITTNMLSVYTMHSIAPEIFVSAQFTYGMSNIKKSRKTGDLANNTATAKATGSNLGGRAEVGYIYSLTDTAEAVPTIGFAHNHVEVGGYTEKGNGLNRKVEKRTTERTSAIAGITLKTIAHMESLKVIPELHANIDYAVSGKNSATKYILATVINRSTPSEKVAKFYFNLGGSVKVAGSDEYDVTAGYDLGLSKKFISHTGSVKLRVNF
jgi:hypothetical protein